ncbi:hypothetical protein DNTS_020779 [Danionella cerebrum]|uniref:GRIP domain-containing protein n=1 Tax=Danionella cerebrum TaxID=2873325 RepID=A0A553MPE1_9TELE|nr:hypothetical protein DNTS_020779 [Danionella translucida]
MFKKLKQKVIEEQSPQRSSAQAQVSSGERRPPAPSLQDAPSSPSDRELLAGMIAEPAFLSEYTIFALDHSKRTKVPRASVKAAGSSPRGSVNGDGIASPQREEGQSLAQKLQQKVSSVESLLRGSSRTDGLFRSGSKDSLVRSSSRDSLNLSGDNENLGLPSYDPPSDIESEAEDSPGALESLSRDQLMSRLHRLERSLGNYRGKYSELVTAYRSVQRDKEKTQAILSQSQDKSLRRIGELREELQMDQQAKKHLQEEFDATLEEKDQMISVLQTQVSLLKKRLQASGTVISSELEASPAADVLDGSSEIQSPSKEEENLHSAEEGNSDTGSSVDLEELQKRVRRQESLLQRCKELIRSSKERSAQLSSENEILQQQLQERLMELEKIKELHTTEKTKLITQLGDAKNLIEQLEQDKGMVIAETKRQMHETLEMKEEEIAQLRSRLQQSISQKDELQEQKEKSEKAAFEELERALCAAQRAEEARRQLQISMDEQVKQVEKTSDEERRNLQQELSRVKQEVVNIMKKSSEDRLAEMEHLHSEALASKEQELSAQIKQAVEQCREELLRVAQERDQQMSLALEEAELQKAAVQAEGENKAQELQLELESARTRIQELESCLGSPEKLDELSVQMEEQKKTFEAELAALEEAHKQELDKANKEQMDALKQQHGVYVDELIQKHKAEIESIQREKEEQFHSHVEDMNKKVLDKLSDKQNELETMSSELTEVLSIKQQLEENLLSMETSKEILRRDYEERLKEEDAKFRTVIDTVKQKELSFAGTEKLLKEEINQLKVVLEEKGKTLEEHILREKSLQESNKAMLEESRSQISTLTEELERTRNQCKELEGVLETVCHDNKEKEFCLEQKKTEIQELVEKMGQMKRDLSENEKLQDEQNRLKKQLDDQKSSYEKKLENIRKDMDCKLKSQENKLEKFKLKTKEAHDKLKKKLQEQEESAKSELAKKVQELELKDQQLKEKILEMAQASSEGLSTVVTDLEANHRENLEKLQITHKQELQDLVCHWQEKLNQNEEELHEKHSQVLQEKTQELEEVSRLLLASKEEKGQVVEDIQNLREELAMRETTVQKLQTELRETAIKLESLSESEGMLKKQVETMEKNLNQALNERNLLQDELSKAGEASKVKLQAISAELEQTKQMLSFLETSKCKEGEDLQRALADKSIEFQNKEEEFKSEFEQCSLLLQMNIDSFSNELGKKVEERVVELQQRVVDQYSKVTYIRNIIMMKEHRISTLETDLQNTVEENRHLKSSLNEVTLQFRDCSETLKALQTEKENDATNHSQVISERDLSIKQLCEEKESISDTLQSNFVQISNLESLTTDLKSQLASSITEKEEAISLLNQQHTEDKEAISKLQETVQNLEKEKSLLQEQAETLRNKFSELKKKFSQSASTVKSLQDAVAEKDEQLQMLTASIDNHSISKSEMDQALSEKDQRLHTLSSELEFCSKKVVDLEELLDLRTKERDQLSTEVEEAHNQSSQSDTLILKTEESLQSLKKEVQTFKQELESQAKDFERQKDEMLREKNEAVVMAQEKASSEMAVLKKKAEQKIGMIRKQLNSQIEDKELVIRDLQTKLEGVKQTLAEREESIRSLEEVEKTKQEATGKLKEEHAKHLQKLVEREKDEQASLQNLKDMYEEKLADLHKDMALKEEQSADAAREISAKFAELEAKLLESSEQITNYQNEVRRLKADLEQTSQVQELQQACSDLQVQSNENIRDQKEQISEVQTTCNRLGMEQEMLVAKEHYEDWAIQKDLMVKDFEEKLQDLQQRLEAKENELKTQQYSPQRNGEMDDECLINDTNISEKELQRKLLDAENEKQKLHKDYTRLQKDLRSLRKEHEKELEFLKKEMVEENEKKLKMQIYCSQKAQSVEAELIESHRDEVSQLQKIISQKEDDLNRTVQRYEDVLQSREVEMGDRVLEVQKELEGLQRRSLSGPQGLDELKVQLAQKTTLLSEATLKEQEYHDRIHALEDKLRRSHKNAVVTHLGSTYRGMSHSTTEPLSEATEFEYLKKVMFEYMMGRETKTMAKVITSMLKFPPDLAQKVLEREDSRVMHCLGFAEAQPELSRNPSDPNIQMASVDRVNLSCSVYGSLQVVPVNPALQQRNVKCDARAQQQARHLEPSARNNKDPSL